MSETPNLAAIADRHGSYQVEAYAFVGEGLRHASKRLGRDQASGEDRHLDAPELVEGVLELAASRYGLLARQVLAAWNIRRSEDIGAITFHLIEDGIFGKRPEDSEQDFADGPLFDEALPRLVRARLERVLR